MTPLLLLTVLAALCPGPHRQPGSCHLDAGRADAACTPGAFNSAVTQATIQSTICVRGWTATVRPPVSYTNALKRRQMIEYGLTGPPAGYKLDHVVPLEGGGSPRDPRNLFPQPNDASHVKDREENALNRAVCNGQMKLRDAQEKIIRDWVHQ